MGFWFGFLHFEREKENIKGKKVIEEICKELVVRESEIKIYCMGNVFKKNISIGKSFHVLLNPKMLLSEPLQVNLKSIRCVKKTK